MLEVNERIHVPDDEFQWSYARSGGPGGQNVNKVASKALLRWDLAGSPSVPEDVKARLRAQQPGRMTVEGEMLVTSERFRDQERNRQDCLEKLGAMLLQAAVAPKPRKPTKVSKGAKRARLADKKRRSARKQDRRRPADD